MEYKQLKLWPDLHKRIKTLAAQNNMTVNEYLDQLTKENNATIELHNSDRY